MNSMNNDICNNSQVEINMTKLLDQRLKQKGCVFPKGTTVGESSAALSQRLGKLLALAVPTNDDSNNSCTDEETFQLRMRTLQSALEKRRSTKASSSSTKPNKPSRRELLIKTVGAQKAQQIIALIREIRVLRLRRRDLLNNSKALESHQPMMCGRGGCNANVYTLPTVGNNRLSREVRDLFFSTVIVDALEKSPVANFEQQPWDHLYDQGVKHVKAYRAWLAKNNTR
ncbi:expressed unknown protein [Seminavis robusta]|uniref:Uncharacterized protein n=1 Tax=Seminavis robusta TaxID=568900 RepID=A0A9N8HHC7_9STRA|nr:expressed unknown protein [Seminavis robusta]|eukprot:Sro529_g161050.1 n/a (228) ;mRNA; r:35671-36448